MIAGRTVCLMYHELELPDRALCHSEAGYVRYIVSVENFRKQLEALSQAGLQGISVSQMLDGVPGVALTFDDGCETDLLAAAPALQEMGFKATFYVTIGFLDTRGYLSQQQLRDLAKYDFDIGCHSVSHPYLTDLDASELHREIVESKDSLQQIAGKAVMHFSCPGGRWDSRVAEIARNAGYRSVATSRTGVNSASRDVFCLARIAVMRDTALPVFRSLAAGRGLWPKQLREATRSAIRKAMGNSMYDKLRSRLLKDA
jgi:peptidoglycan/xylan/chitin deacetylase (PgdA/CDA1 family)